MKKDSNLLRNILDRNSVHHLWDYASHR